jgi:hypothetical protein
MRAVLVVRDGSAPARPPGVPVISSLAEQPGQCTYPGTTS